MYYSFNIFFTSSHLSPIAVGGDRFGAWLTKTYESKWELFVKSNVKNTVNYELVYQSENYPEPKFLWNKAKDIYTKDRGLNSWGL